MLAKVTKLFFAVGRGSLGTKLIKVSIRSNYYSPSDDFIMHDDVPQYITISHTCGVNNCSYVGLYAISLADGSIRKRFVSVS